MTSKKASIFIRFLMCLIVLVQIVIAPIYVHAAPTLQGDDPAVQCEKGAQLWDEGKYSEALPYLEQGFSNREKGHFVRDDVGVCAALLGKIYHSLGRTDEALEVYLFALQIFRNGENLKGESLVLNDLGAVLHDLGRDTEALAYYQDSLSIIKARGYRGEEGITLSNIGMIYFTQEEYDNALSYLQQAQLIQQEVGDRRGEGVTMSNIGQVYYKQEKYYKALEYFQKALTIIREVGDKEVEGQLLNYVGSVNHDLGLYSEALRYFEEALVIDSDTNDPRGFGIILNNIAVAYASLGQYAKALEYYFWSLEVEQKIGNKEEVGRILNNIGNTYIKQGRYSDALIYLNESLNIFREIDNKIGESAALTTIGVVYEKQGLLDDALINAKQALSIRRNMGDLKGEALVLNNIGGLYTRIEQYTAALEYYQQSLSISQEIDDLSGVSITLSDIGWVFYKQGNYDESLSYAKKALEAHQKSGDLNNEGLTYLNLGTIYEAKGQFPKALENYEQAMSIFETLRSVSGSEFGRSSFIAQYEFLYDRTIALYISQNKFEEAFNTSERGRSRSFLDSIATGYVELNDNQSAELYAQEREAYAFRLSLHEALNRAKAQNPVDQELITDLEARLTQAEVSYQTTLNSITAAGDNLEQLIPGRNKVLNVKQSQELLNDETTLLSFWVTDQSTYVFVLTRNSLNVLELNISREELNNQIEALRSFPNIDSPYPDSSIQIHETIIEPLKPYLTKPNLIIIPHQNLHYLPFAALTDGNRYLLDDYSLVYLPSVSAWPFIMENNDHKGGNLLILGNPTTNNSELKPLAYAESEAKVIADLFNMTPLLGKEATESALNAHAAQAGILHIAAHGSYNSTNPLYSALYLAPDEGQDGILETHEIYKLNLKQINLVVLSACETQWGKLSSGDEVVGMTRAFFFAGTPSVVSTLWEVDDQATKIIMEKFYRNLLSGMTKKEALRRAQIEMRAKYPNPYYWAGFVLNGDGEQTIKQVRSIGWLPENLPNCINSISLGVILIVIQAAKRKKFKRI